MEILVSKTQRGFDVIKFDDSYGQKCSLQKSSIATEDCIWFGAHSVYEEESQRMHLTREQVKALLPFLQCFAETGEIIEP